MQISIHDITGVKVETNRADNGYLWVVLTFKNNYGEQDVFTLWPNNNNRTLIPFADTINTENVPEDEHAENVHANDNGQEDACPF